MKSNFRRGGLILLPATIFAIILAIAVNAPTSALISISVFGFATAIILIVLGDRRVLNKEIS